MESFRRDLVYAVRSLWSAKRFSGIVIATLALGLGANVAVFSVLHAVVLRPLPYAEPERLVRVYHVAGDTDNYKPLPAFLAFRDGSTTLDLAPVYTYNSEGADLTDRAQPERVTVLRVGADYFRTIGVRPILGQPFTHDDERETADAVVIGERVWREYLGARPDAIGQTLSVNGARQRVVAVLPDAFEDPYHTWNAGRADRPESESVSADQRVVEGRFFEALGVRVLRGRTFGPQDAATPRQAIINERLARTLYPNEDPIGRRLRVSGGEAEIIGVVGDVAVSARAATPAIVYHLHRQFAANRNWALTEVVSSDRPLAPLLDDIRRELGAIDPALVLYQPRMLSDVIGRGIAQERFAMLVVAAYALLALTLASIGLYGVLSYSVSRRQREMGIRLALGAQTSAVRTLVVREGAMLAIVGVMVGVGVALLATRALGTLLFNVPARDPLTFVVAATVLVTIALVASWIPARAATKIDPIHALRGEA